MVLPAVAVAAAAVEVITWAVVWIGGRFAIKELAKVTAKQLPKVFAHVKSATKPVLKATNKNPRGVFRADGSLSRASHITPVGQGTPFWNKTFTEAAKNPKAATIFSNFKAGMSKKKTIAALVGIGMVPETANLLLEHMDTETEYNVLTGEEVSKGGIRRDIEARAKELFDFEDAKRVPDYITDYRAELKTDPYRDDKRALRSRVPEYAVSTLRAEPVRTTVESPEQLAKDAETETARQYIQEQNRLHDDRTAMERAAIRDASPKFTQAELSPYRKVSEPGLGQKLFGLRRSKSEIDRDVKYTDLKMQGRDEAADQYWADWNAENKAKRDAALGGAGSLTEYTKDDADRETSFAEDIVKKVNKVLPKKKRGGGQVSSRPKSYRTAKVIKQYAKGGSVRKPNRIK